MMSMSMSMSMSSSGRSNRHPFTTSQWQELEHQALIFKYMVSGIPIPPDLLFSIKTSFDSSLPSKLMLQPQHVGWNCFQMGFGRKIDPEPGRCRRTDGKKWRCSKEAYPDSKYCERHMHRGRNRSRKPVELVNNINTTTTASSTNLDSKIPQQTSNISSITRNYTNPPSNFPPQSNHPTCSTTATTTTHFLSPLSSIPSESESASHHNNNHPCFSNHHQHNSSGGTTTLHHPFLYPHSSSSSRPPGIGLSSQDNNTHFLLDSSPYSHSDKDFRNRYGQGMKEEGDRHAFYQESCGTMRSTSGSSVGDSWHLEPLTMGSSSSIMAHQKQRNSSALRSPYSSSSSSSSYLQLSDTPKQDHHHHQQYYMMGSNRGSDLNCEMAFKSERVCGDDEPQKVMHHFFDEWPPTNKDSTTQLSISIPTAASHDFFMSRNDK